MGEVRERSVSGAAILKWQRGAIQSCGWTLGRILSIVHGNSGLSVLARLDSCGGRCAWNLWAGLTPERTLGSRMSMLRSSRHDYLIGVRSLMPRHLLTSATIAVAESSGRGRGRRNASCSTAALLTAGFFATTCAGRVATDSSLVAQTVTLA